jgi:alpha-tubulin suppressor-like RCC1 family protein
MNSDGQLGNGTTMDSVSAVTVTGLSDAEDIGLYARAVFVRTSTGLIKAWGDNAYGQLGDGTYSDRSTPTTIVLNDVTQLGIGFVVNCALRSDKSVACWGSNGYNQLGIYDTRVSWEVSGE